MTTSTVPAPIAKSKSRRKPRPKVETKAKAKAKAAPQAPLVALAGAVAFFKRLCGMESLAALLGLAGGYERCWAPCRPPSGRGCRSW